MKETKKKENKLHIRALLANRDYTAFWFASACSMAASNILQFVLALYVLQKTGSATIFATTLAVIVIPRICLTPIAGVLGDKYPRIKLMTLLMAIDAAVLALFVFLSAKADGLSLGYIYALTAFLEIIEVFYQAPEAAIITELVPKELLDEAVTVSKIDNGFVYVMTPVIGTLAYRSFGLTGGLCVSAGGFFAAMLLQSIIRPRYARTEQAPGEKRKFRDELAQGLQTIRENSFLRQLVRIGPSVNFFFASVFSVTITYLLLNVYQVGETVFGVYRAVTASTAVLTPIVAVSVIKKKKAEEVLPVTTKIIAFSLFAIAVCVLLQSFRIAENPLWAIIAVTVLDCITIAAAIHGQMSSAVLLQEIIPDELKSRVLSVVRMFTLTAIPLGELFFGWITDRLPIYLPVFISALGLWFCAAGYTRAFRREAAQSEQTQKPDEMQ